jgi:hypothetical protein
MNQATNNVTTLPVEQVNPEPQPPNYGGTPVTLQTFEPWPEPVGGEVIDEYQELLSRFMFITKREQLVCTLWVVHANCYNIFKKTPRLILTAGDYGCGKSTLMTILQASVTRSKLFTHSSPAAFFTLSQNGGAFFLDEADKWIAGRGESRIDILNTLQSGFDRNGMVQRADLSNGRTVLEFPTHTAVALSGKGLNAKGLGNALMARSHVIAMRKALKGDVQEEFDDRHHLHLFHEMGRKLVRLCIDNKDAFANYDRRGEYPLPDHLLGRDGDIWEPLFAIAVVLGGNWYEKVCGLVEDEPQKLDEGGTALFWTATNDILTALRASGYNEDIIQPADYAKRLAEWEDENGIRPYADYHVVYSMDGKRIQANDIRNILRPYGIKSIQKKLTTGKNWRGFLIIELMDAVDRHLSDGSCSGVADVAVLQEVSS